jgi:UDP-N-acetyl-2-amino-2-deoxyglucuronate dehydrogenase
MKNFIIIGVAGYVAEKHLKAIKDNDGQLIAAYDISDSVGILDSYFPAAKFFTTFERFERFVDDFQQNNTIDYLIVCSPNYLHDSHIRFGLKYNMHVICEKPVVLNLWNLEKLIITSTEAKKQVFPLLQLRYHPDLLALKDSLTEKNYKVKLEYIAPRGQWYTYSWKGSEEKSGGILMNIGVHFFDLLLWLFGDVLSIELFELNSQRASGRIITEKADIDWKLSIDPKDKPNHNDVDMKPYKNLTINEKSFDLDLSFKDLHTLAYNNILNNTAITINECIAHTQLINNIKKLSNL